MVLHLLMIQIFDCLFLCMSPLLLLLPVGLVRHLDQVEGLSLLALLGPVGQLSLDVLVDALGDGLGGLEQLPAHGLLGGDDLVAAVGALGHFSGFFG